MEWETLPDWFWILLYLLLLATLVTAVISLFRKKRVPFAIIAIIMTLTIPLVSIYNSIGRSAGYNEFEHLLHKLSEGSLWSIYVSLGYVYILFWWITIFVPHNKQH
ncbi:hypothetical protein ACFQ3J_11490 [Paenibacillus provencensis]|uniref:Transmembrane protein n=1 Tax=Paenibacillus provencensis TaxID=441151 RepID=A0ABW3Q6V9_9BACL|nr:hypothetical protein [Paenibacillus sp. MER 78]MCM3127265.1 hypothetical protein [Paenibacillus sp. MER 78]